MKILTKKFVSFIFVAVAALLSACASLPDGAVAPKLTINAITLQNQDNLPVFLVDYTIEHNSQTALPVKNISADIFIKDTRIASINQQTSDFNVPNNTVAQYQLAVPVTAAGSATVDSLLHNSLLLLEGSCALTVSFTDDPELASFRPSTSYQGFIKQQ